MKNEYPKCLYFGGELYGEHRIAHDHNEEVALSSDGFVPFVIEKKQDESQKRRGRPPKAKTDEVSE